MKPADSFMRIAGFFQVFERTGTSGSSLILELEVGAL
jgi:hypothetical protein